MPGDLAEVRVHLRDVDAPELGHRAKCDAEREADAKAKAFAEELLDAAVTVAVRDSEWGKWGGRVVADMVLDGKHSLADWVEFGTPEWRCAESAPVETAAPAAPGDIQAEVERYVIDPCLKVAIGNGTVPEAERFAGMTEAQAVAAIKTIARAELLALAPTVRPLLAGRPWPIREKFYAFLRAVCIADFGGGTP